MEMIGRLQGLSMDLTAVTGIASLVLGGSKFAYMDYQ